MLMLILINLVVVISSVILTRNFFKIKQLCDYILTVFILFLAQIILVELLLGSIGILYFSNVFIAHLVILTVVYLSCSNRNNLVPEKPDVEPFINNNLLILAFSVFSAFFLIKSYINFINPPICPDSLQYHLTFPAAWIKSGKLDSPFVIFQGIFSFNHPRIEVSGISYFPINAELFFAWLMMPLRNAFLADSGQVPFYIIGIIAVYSILRKYAVDTKIALLSGFLWALIPNIFKQLKNGSQVDVICSVFLLLVFNSLLLLRKDFTYRKAVLFGILAGIFAGVKFFNVIWLTAFIALIFYILYGGFKSNKFSLKTIVCFLAVIMSTALLFGGYIYIKNLIFTGNPVFPNEVKIFGRVVFKGLIDLAAYNKLYASGDRFDLGRFIFGEGLGVQFVALILPGLILPFIFFGYLKKKTHPFGEYLFSSITPLAMLILYGFFANAYVVRYLFPFLTIGFITAVIFINKLPGGVKYIKIVAFISIIASACELAHRYELIVSLLLSLLFFIVLFVYRKQIIAFYRSKAFIKAALIFSVLALMLLIYFNWRYDQNEFRRYPFTFSKKEAWQADIARGWQKLNEITGKGAKIAYTGRQEFYPLFGSKLKNDVKYVSVNAEEALPYKSLDGNCRQVKDFTAWRQNLKKENIEYLFIALPFFDNRESNDPTKFPIEDEWASSHPVDFQLLFSNSLCHIYKVEISSG